MSDRVPAIRVLLLPKDTNAYGTIFGGVILSQHRPGLRDRGTQDRASQVRDKGDARSRVPRAGVRRRYRGLLHRDSAGRPDVGDGPCRGGGRAMGKCPARTAGTTGHGERVKVTEAEVVLVAVDDRAGRARRPSRSPDSRALVCHSRPVMKWISSTRRHRRRCRSSTRCLPGPRPTAASTCPSVSIRCRPAPSIAFAAPDIVEIGTDDRRAPAPGRDHAAGARAARSRGARLPGSARPGDRSHLGARAVSRADDGVQGRRRPGPGATAASLHRRHAADDSGRDLGRHRAAPLHRRFTACRTRGSSSCIRKGR